MQRNECKPGTEVIIRGTIKEDDGTTVDPILVEIHDNECPDAASYFEPSSLEPVQPKYDPARKYRKGDLVRITGFHGRLFGCGNERKLSEGNEIGTQVTLCEDERYECDVCIPEGVLSDNYNYLSAACVELVKPVEEIEAEQPYKIKDVCSCFRILKNSNYVYEIFWKSNICAESPYSKEEALKKAQELCDELNRKHSESLNA